MRTLQARPRVDASTQTETKFLDCPLRGDAWARRYRL
jgi:hypothetical protein